MSCEALRIAKKQTSLRVADVAFLDDTATQCAPSVCARDAVVDENKPSLPRKPARAGESRVDVHVHLHRFAAV